MVSTPPDGLHHPVRCWRRLASRRRHRPRYPPDDDVVDHRGICRVEEMGVLGASRGYLAGGRWSVPTAAGRRRRPPSTRTVPRWLTSNATASLTAGTVFGDGAVAVGQGHLPAAEAHQLRPECPMDTDQGGVLQVAAGHNRRLRRSGRCGVHPSRLSPGTITRTGPQHPDRHCRRPVRIWPGEPGCRAGRAG